jgi:hypothetical protein
MATTPITRQIVNVWDTFTSMPDATSALFDECLDLVKNIRQKCSTVEAECDKLVRNIQFVRVRIEEDKRDKADYDFSVCRTFSAAAYKYLVESQSTEANALEIFTALQRGNFGRAKEPAGWGKFWAAINSPNTREPLGVERGGSDDRETWVIRVRQGKKPVRSF